MTRQHKEDIIEWYKTYKRELPWRQTQDAYHIWLSEIILQQTRVQQGLPYYNKFIKTYPNIVKLAQAQESDILHLWQGLGYYSRARNMHFTAKYIVQNFNGIFPNNYKSIRNLKGVGDYTAAAIASFAFGLPYVALDGNVLRVISRLYGIEEDIMRSQTKKVITALAHEMMGKTDPALFNQSMMEFGAIQCKPASPDCSICPVQDHCYALLNNKVNLLPVKVTKTKVQKRHFNYLIMINQKDKVYIRQRIGKGIWQNLFEFPMIESAQELKQSDLMKNIHQYCENGAHLKFRSKEIKHKLSHQLLHIQFNIIKCSKIKVEPDWILIPLSQVEQYAFPEIINKNKKLIFDNI